MARRKTDVYKSSIYLHRGDMDAIKQLWPEHNPSEVIRDLVRRAVRSAAARKGVVLNHLAPEDLTL